MLVVKSTPYHLQVYNSIKENILSGKMKNGERINEIKLAASLGVSRSPVREAIRMLMQDEILVPAPSGSMVNPMELNYMREVLQCRIPVESFAARLAVSCITDDEIAKMKDYLENARHFCQLRDYEKVIENNTKFHETILNACPNAHLKTMINRNKELAILSRRQKLCNYNWNEGFMNEHAEILDAIIQRDEDMTESLVRKHIENWRPLQNATQI